MTDANFFSYLTTLTTANYAWNKETKAVLPTTDWVLQKMPAFVGSLSYKPNPAAGKTLTPLTVAKSTKVSGWANIKQLGSTGSLVERDQDR